MLTKGGWNTLHFPLYGQSCVGWPDGESGERGLNPELTLICLAKQVERYRSGILHKNSGWNSVSYGNAARGSVTGVTEAALRKQKTVVKSCFPENIIRTFINILHPGAKLERSFISSSLGHCKKKVAFRKAGNTVLRSGIGSREFDSFKKLIAGKKFVFRVNSPRHISEGPAVLSVNKGLWLRQDHKSAAQHSLTSQNRQCPSGSKTLFEGEIRKSERRQREKVKCRQARRTPRDFERMEEENAVSKDEGENWKRLSQALVARQAFPSIPNQELMKVAELRFSSDMQEGDSGEQVNLLQRVLFWFGYLPDQSYITGYFGAETKKALQEFQEAHGVHKTGYWGSLSKQALWHNISAEILHRVGDEKAGHRNELPAIPGEKNIIKGVGWQVWPTIKQWKVEAISGDWKLLSSGNIWFAFLLGGALLGMVKVISSIEKLFQHQPLKRRILQSQWYVDSGRHTRAHRVFQKGKLGLTNYNTGGNNFHSRLSVLQNQADSPGAYDQRINEAEHLQVHCKQVTRKDSSVPLEVSQKVQCSMDGSVAPLQPNLKDQLVSSLSSARKDERSEGQERWRASQDQIKRNYGIADVNGGRKGADSSSQRNTISPRFDAGNDDLSTRVSYTGKSSQERVTVGDSFSRRTNFTREPVNQRDQEPRALAPGVSNAHRKWQEEDELDLRSHIDQLHRTVQAAERNRQIAMRALSEERQRSLELEVKITRQREAAAALEEEVRVLKESHDALLASLRKKYSSSAAARTAAALLYQNWDNDDNDVEGAPPLRIRS